MAAIVDRADQKSQQDIDIEQTLLRGQNERGIPEVRFIDDVENFLETEVSGAAVETVIGAYTTLLSKFRTYEVNLIQQRMKAKLRVPEIEKTLSIIEQLEKAQEQASGEEATLDTHYNLSDVLYAQAEVQCSGTVCLWLGAQVMVEFTYAEATEWLEKHLQRARERLRTTDEDLQHLRNNKILTEVAIARVYNYDLKKKKAGQTTANDSSVEEKGRE